MPDTLTPSQRSRCMAAIGSKNTTPELIVRRIVHRMGFRFRLHMRSLPGKPEIVLPRHRKIIEVRGCFWHAHHCRNFQMPVTRQKYWASKFRRNVERDEANLKQWQQSGWQVLVLWECDIHAARCIPKLSKFLGIDSPWPQINADDMPKYA